MSRHNVASPALVNRELITRFEKKIQAVLSRVWGEEAPAVDESATAAV